MQSRTRPNGTHLPGGKRGAKARAVLEHTGLNGARRKAKKVDHENGYLTGRATDACVDKTEFIAAHYLIANPDLWESVPEPAAEMHYEAIGRGQGRPIALPFVASFYRDMYLAGEDAWTERELEKNWLASATRQYGSLHEVLFRCGFKPPNWLNHFDAASYISYNYLWDSVRNSTQALVHFITEGVGQLLAISESLEFEPSFARETLEVPDGMEDAALYKHWVEWMLSAHMRSQAFPPNERAMLRRLGLRLSTVPAAFDWQRYFAERPEIAADVARDKWSAIAHFIDTGVLEARAVPMKLALAEPLLRATADRFAERNFFAEGNIAYDRYLLCPNASARGIQHAGDLAFRERKFSRALYLYDRVRALHQPNLWTFVNGAASAHELGEFERAQDLILEGLRLYPRSTRLQQCFFDVQNSVFNLAVTRHVGAVRAEEPQRSTLARDVEEIHRSFLVYYDAQYPGCGGGVGKRRAKVTAETIVITVLANCDLAQCTYYRVSQKFEHLSGIGVRIKVFALDQISGFMSAAATADCVIFYRLAASAATLQCLAYCGHLGLPVVYEIDDLVFDAASFPEALESYGGTIDAQKHFELRAGVALVRSFMALCDYGLASTQGLQAEIAKIVKTGEVIVHRNVLSHELRAMAGSARRAAPRRAGSAVTIFYGSGTLAHARDFKEQIEPALLRLMKQNPDVRFMACGHVDVAALEKAFPSRVALVEFIADRSDYLKLLAAADINIAVLHANRFNDCKSEIKWLEAAAFGIPSVVSDVAVYRETLTNGKDVVITATDKQAWYKALKALVGTPARRAEIGERARARAVELYDPNGAARRLAAGLCAWAGGAADSPAAKGRRRVLVVNVFFPPQAIGGATRIVAAQVLRMREQYAERFDVAVFCGNDEDGVPYEMTAYEWNGVPVYSVNTPLREGNDWNYADPEIRPVFEAVLDRFKPDIVHFHAIQRLTSVVIDALQDRNIPYVVTVHDAWWISDHQFLIDKDDRLEMPWERKPGVVDDTGNASASDTRLRALAMRLKGAKAVLAVSDTFAALYRRSGIANARTLENGLPELPPLEAAEARPGILRIGHFGGMGYIKGLFLLKRALARGAYPGLEAVVVDLSKSWGEEVREVWGQTPVRIVGRVPQDKVGWLYGQIDVLIAPSVWPESFGLVVREAVLYGKWIVVSNRGALPEAVIPEVNGFVIDLNDCAALPAMLERLQAEIDLFRAPPGQAPRIATVAENTEVVCGIYDDILAPSAKPAATARRGIKKLDKKRLSPTPPRVFTSTR
jgi:glycosyltransferase involved in cell wall biosynthesis